MDVINPLIVTPYLLTQVWVLYDQHYYIVSRKTLNYLIIRCATKNCPQTLKVMAGRYMPPAPLHHHEPESWLAERNELYQRLRMRAESEPSALSVIYEDEALRHPIGAQHMPYETVLPAMRVWRRQQQPAVPETLAEYANAIAATSYHHLLLGCVAAGGASAVLLGMPNFRQCLREAQFIIADGTFNSAPVAPRVYQLLTIHVIVSGRYFHPIIVLMENRTRGLYDAVLQLLWRLAGEPNPEVVLTDYETALHAAFQAICPTARVVGCFFHYAQALVRRARLMGIETRRNSAGGRMVHLYVTLALLPPAQVGPAVADLQAAVAATDGIYVDAYHSYFVDYWMRQIGPERFAVGPELHRTTNVAEAFHRSLNGALQRHPNIWQLTAVMEKKLNITNQRYAGFRAGNLRGARNFARHAVRHLECRRLHLELAAGHISLLQCHLRLSRILNLQDPGDDIGANVDVGPAANDNAGPAAAAIDQLPEPEMPGQAAAAIDRLPEPEMPGPAAAAIDPFPEMPGQADVVAQVNDVRGVCQICRLAQINGAFIPCGHTICEICADHIHVHRQLGQPPTCPFCRSHVLQLLRIYF